MKGRLQQGAFVAIARLLMWLRSKDPATKTCLSYFSRENKTSFLQLISWDADLRNQVVKGSSPPTRQEMAVLLVSFGESVWRRGDRAQALTSARLSLELAKDNPLAMIALAEMHLELEDRVANKWAAGLLNFDPAMAASGVGANFASQDGANVLREMRSRSVEIINICHAHPEWRDTSAWLSREEE